MVSPLADEFEHDRQPPFDDVAQRVDLGDRHAPVVAQFIEMLHGATPAVALVELDQAIHERLAGEHLELRIKGRAHRQAAFIERLLAEHLGQLAAHLLGEIVGREQMRGRVSLLDAERRGLGCLALLRRGETVLHHPVDHPIAPFDRAVRIAERIVVIRRLGQCREIGGLGQRQLVHRLVEILERRRGDAIGAEPEKDLVEVEFEDLVLAVGLLDAQRQDRFLDLAGDALLVAEQEVLRHLLGDRRGADQPLAGAIGLDVLDHRAGDSVKVEAGVMVEVLVLGRDEGGLDAVRNRLDRQVQAPFVRVFGDQLSVRGVNARHHRRFVFGENVVVWQILGETRDIPGDTSSNDQE